MYNEILCCNVLKSLTGVLHEEEKNMKLLYIINCRVMIRNGWD